MFILEARLLTPIKRLAVAVEETEHLNMFDARKGLDSRIGIFYGGGAV